MAQSSNARKQERLLQIEAEPILDLPPALARFQMSELYYIRIVNVRDENRKWYKGVVLVSARYFYLGNFDGGMNRALNHNTIRHILMADVRKKKLIGGYTQERQYLIKAEYHDILFSCYAGESKNGPFQDLLDFERLMRMISDEMCRKKARPAPIQFSDKTGDVSETEGLLPLASLIPPEGYLSPLQRLQQHRKIMSYAEQLPKIREQNLALQRELTQIQSQGLKAKQTLEVARKEGADAALKDQIDEFAQLTRRLKELKGEKTECEKSLLQSKQMILEKSASVKDEMENKEHHFNMACEEEASKRFAQHEEDIGLRRKQQTKEKNAVKERTSTIVRKLTEENPRPWSNAKLKEKDQEFISVMEKVTKIQNQRLIEQKFKETVERDKADMQRKLLTTQAALQVELEKLENPSILQAAIVQEEAKRQAHLKAIAEQPVESNTAPIPSEPEPTQKKDEDDDFGIEDSLLSGSVPGEQSSAPSKEINDAPLDLDDDL